MNREFKFRAWDKENECWYKTELEFYGFALFGECTLICPPRISDLQNLIVTQYTGLHDKNGKEIYESDIVKSGKGLIVEVCWEQLDGAFRCGDENRKSHVNWTLGHFITDGLEVIGNIYENYDLLEDK